MIANYRIAEQPTTRMYKVGDVVLLDSAMLGVAYKVAYRCSDYYYIRPYISLCGHVYANTGRFARAVDNDLMLIQAIEGS